MGLLTNLFRIVWPTFPAGYCPQSYQQLADDLMGGTQITLLIDTGNFLYNYGSVTPAPENRIFPWLNTEDGLWWTFQYGLWVSPVNQSDLVTDFRKIWIPAQGTLESAAWSLDGGDGTDPSVVGNVSEITGAMWTVDHGFDGRFPIGAGTVPDSDLGSGSASIGINQPADSFGRSGEYAHELTAAEMNGHWHGVGTDGAPDGNDPPIMLSRSWTIVDGIVRRFEDSGGSGASWGDGAVLTGGTMGSTNPMSDVVNLSTKHNTMPPYLGTWFLKHTARKYRTRPA